MKISHLFIYAVCFTIFSSCENDLKEKITTNWKQQNTKLNKILQKYTEQKQNSHSSRCCAWPATETCGKHVCWSLYDTRAVLCCCSREAGYRRIRTEVCLVIAKPWPMPGNITTSVFNAYQLNQSKTASWLNYIKVMVRFLLVLFFFFKRRIFYIYILYMCLKSCKKWMKNVQEKFDISRSSKWHLLCEFCT